MAKERLTLYDKYGNPIDYDISASSVTIDIEGKSLDVKLSEIAAALLQEVTEVTFNGTAHNRENGKINIGSQMQPDWSESSPTYPSYIRNKPDFARVATSGDYNDLQNRPTIPAGVTADSELSDTSENAVQNKVIKAAIDTLSNTLNTLIGSGNVQGAIDTFNEVVAFLNGISSSDTLAAKLATLVPNTRKVNGKALSSDVTIGMSDIQGLETAIADAGKVKSVSVNGGTPSQPDAQGNVNVVVPAGEKGEKGDTGNVQVDGNGNVLIYNGRDMTTTGAALDASQGQFLGKMLNAKDNTFYNVWVGTQAELEALEEYEDNTIFIVGTIPTVVQRFNVSFNGGDHTSVPASTPQTVKEGSAFSVVVSPASGYTIDTATGTMVGGTLTKTTNQDGTVTFSTSSVTGAISIQAAATKHITGITVTAGTRAGNSIPLTAAVSPTGADNVTLAWSVNDTTNFAISGNGTSATLTIKEGASNASVVITCADTNAASGTKSGTLQLTGLTYDNTIPTTAITDIATQRTGANTLQLSAVADGNTHTTPTFALSGQVPTVKQVRRWDAGDEVDGETMAEAGHDLIDVPAVVLNNDNTLTYKGDCEVQVTATAQVNGTTISKSKTITITHDNADAIWFEDPLVKQKLMTAGSKGTSTAYGSNGEITYSQAAEQGNTTANGNALRGSAIIRFNEWKYFTYSYFDVTNCSSLISVELPKVTGLSAFDSRFGISGTKLTTVEIPEGYTTYGASSGSYAQLPIQGTTITSIVFPTSLTKFANKIKDLPNLTKVDLSQTSLQDTSSAYALIQYNFQGDSSGLAKLAEIDLPSGIFKLQGNTFRNCSALRKLTLRYDGVVANNSAFQNIPLSSIDLYVPASQVDAYQASSVWNGAKSINAITE